MSEAQPTVTIYVNNVPCTALLDSGCSHTIVSARLCRTWKERNITVTTIGGETQACCGAGTVKIHADSGVAAELNVLVTQGDLLGFDLLLGYDAIKALGGVVIARDGGVRFLETPMCAAIHIDRPDFQVDYDDQQKAWTASWKWSDNRPPERLSNQTAEYTVPKRLREEYDHELQTWIDNGWLVPYPEKELGPPKGLIPLMAIIQENKDKVRPVMDYRELNGHVDAYTARADVCSQKLREWRMEGSDVSVLDLRRAYLQVHVHKSLWPFQTVLVEGQRYCLTRMGFGLNVAPAIMQTIVEAVLSQDDAIERATSAYIDDVFVNDGVTSADRVKRHLLRFGLESKDPERLEDGTRVLGLEVWGERDALYWKRGNVIPDAPKMMTRRNVFSLCGKLVGHFPVCGWLRAATGVIKRRANAVTKNWDSVTADSPLRCMVSETIARIRQEDPAQGPWCVDGRDVNVWVDASSVATGVLLERDGITFEDACWLRSVDNVQHINMAELDAAIKGINMALQWKATILHLKTDSVSVYHWLLNTLTGKTRVRTKATSEMLLRRRLETIKQLVEEYGLTIDVSLVPSNQNLADPLTRVPQRWLEKMKREVEPMPTVCIAVEEEMTSERIRELHRGSGHPGIRRTTYYARRVCPSVTKAAVRAAISTCEECRTIDPAPVRWPQGKLSVETTWHRLGMDITHYAGKHFLTLTDCGPSRFSVWRPLQRQDSASVIRHLNAIFFERGPPQELLTDNDTAFASGDFKEFADSWGIHLRFRCAYVPAGNGIAERCHRSVKRIAARMGCSLQEAVYWYNMAPKDDVTAQTAPANGIYRYEVRVKGIDPVKTRPAQTPCKYKDGDPVWVKTPGYRCTSKFRRGRVSGVISQQSVLVDGTPRHIRDLRPAAEVYRMSSEESDEPSSDELFADGIDDSSPPESESSESDDAKIQDVDDMELPAEPDPEPDPEPEPEPEPQPEPPIVPLRRSQRIKRPAPHCTLCDHEIRGECNNYERNKRPRVCTLCLTKSK